jgi:hypothetical protein
MCGALVFDSVKNMARKKESRVSHKAMLIGLGNKRLNSCSILWDVLIEWRK